MRCLPARDGNDRDLLSAPRAKRDGTFKRAQDGALRARWRKHDRGSIAKKLASQAACESPLGVPCLAFVQTKTDGRRGLKTSEGERGLQLAPTGRGASMEASRLGPRDDAVRNHDEAHAFQPRKGRSAGKGFT